MESPEKSFNTSFEQGHLNYNRFVNRLEDAQSFADVIDSIKDATVTDEEGDAVVFDIINFREDGEEINTVPAEELIAAVQHLAEQGASHADDVFDMTQHQGVANAVSRIIFKSMSAHE